MLIRDAVNCTLGPFRHAEFGSSKGKNGSFHSKIAHGKKTKGKSRS